MTEVFPLPPYLIYLLGALFTPLVLRLKQRWLLLLIPVLAGVNNAYLQEGTVLQLSLHGISLQPLLVDGMSLFFSWIFHLIAFLSLLYGFETLTRKEWIAANIYTASALGVVFSGDMFSFYVFWELLGLSALVFILERRRKFSISASMHYMLMHLAGGLSLLVGLLMQFHESNSEALTNLELSTTSSYLIFFGIGMNAAWPLFHTWLTDAYPKATIAGTVFLSALTTKSAIYALARFFPGVEMLIWIGAVMAAFPIFYAVIENDLRKVLAYSLINQVGFMVVGVGVGGDMGLNGALAHAFNDILFKGLLFMSVGAVMFRTGKVRATDLGGLYRCMPLTCLFCVVGAASISAFPLFSGFVSKSMVMAAVAESHLTLIWLILLFASAGVFHHAGIKIPFFVFFGHDSGLRVKEAPKSMTVAMALTAILCVGIGAFPDSTVYAILPYPNSYEPYTTHHVIAQLQLLLFSALAFVLLLRSGIYPAEIRCVNLDSDWFSKKLIPNALQLICRFVSTCFDLLEHKMLNLVRSVCLKVGVLPRILYSVLGHFGGTKRSIALAEGHLLPVGYMALWCLLALCLLSVYAVL